MPTANTESVDCFVRWRGLAMTIRVNMNADACTKKAEVLPARGQLFPKPILTSRVAGSEKRRFDVYKQYTKTEYHS